MDKKAKTWVAVIGGILLIVIFFTLLFKFWQSFVIGAVCFGFGYYLGKRNKSIGLPKVFR